NPRLTSVHSGVRNSSTSPPETVSARTSAVTPAGPDTPRAYPGDGGLPSPEKVGNDAAFVTRIAGSLDGRGRLAVLRQRGGDVRPHPRAAPGRTRARSRRAHGDRGRVERARRRHGHRRGGVRRGW